MESQPNAGVTSDHGQFFHLEKYAIRSPHGKADANDILKVACEADRVPGYCSHVEHPRPPVQHLGVSMREAAAMSRAWAEAKYTPYLGQGGQEKKRRYRIDEPCALVGVVSVPPKMPEARWCSFREKAVAWLRRKFGDRLKSVVEHRDEPQLHLHFWVVPRHGEDFSAVHPGVLALRRLGRTAKRVDRDLAYKAAMSALQDEFHSAVAGLFGLARKSVSGERWSREEFNRRKAMKAREEEAYQRGAAVAAAELPRLEKEMARLRAVMSSARPVPDVNSASPPSEPVANVSDAPCGTVPHPAEASRPRRTGPRM